jgi:hypothetical protein
MLIRVTFILTNLLQHGTQLPTWVEIIVILFLPVPERDARRGEKLLWEIYLDAVTICEAVINRVRSNGAILLVKGESFGHFVT